MWFSVAMAGLGAIFILPKYPLPGFVIFILSSVSAVISGIFKKRYCPRCQENASSDIPVQKE